MNIPRERSENGSLNVVFFSFFLLRFLIDACIYGHSIGIQSHQFVRNTQICRTLFSFYRSFDFDTYTQSNTARDSDVSQSQHTTIMTYRHTCDLNMCWAPHRSIRYVKTGFDCRFYWILTDATNGPEFCLFKSRKNTIS